MNMVRDLTSVVLSSREAPLSCVPDIRRMVREADHPELEAAYQRCEELEWLLLQVRACLAARVPVVGIHEVHDIHHPLISCINQIDDALDPHRVLS